MRARHHSPTFSLALASLLLAAGLVACSGQTGDDQDGQEDEPATTAATGIQELQEFADLSQDHVEGTVDYPQEPPVGGPHAPVWQNCGAYADEIAAENAVHALEHGAVWITHEPDLDENQVNELRARAAVDTHVLVSPRDGLPSPVVASAWGLQVQLDDATDDRLDDFVAQYANGPQTPEPGAPCDGGIGEPIT